MFSLDGSKDPLDKLPGFFLLTDLRSFVSGYFSHPFLSVSPFFTSSLIISLSLVG